jgi:hypothetical protein
MTGSKACPTDERRRAPLGTRHHLKENQYLSTPTTQNAQATEAEQCQRTRLGDELDRDSIRDDVIGVAAAVVNIVEDNRQCPITHHRGRS